MKYALWLVGKRDYSVFSIRKKLVEKEYQTEEIEETISKLIKLKFLDDTRFTRNYIDSQRRIKPIGNQLLYQKLLLKGIDKETIKEQLDQPEDDLIVEAVQNWLKKHPLEDKWAQKQKLMAYLSRRGFGYDEIIEVQKQLED